MQGKVQKTLGPQPLRGHVDQLIAPGPGPFQRQGVLPLREGAVEKSRRDARLHQRRHLIPHQGDQGRDHQGDPLQQQRGQLETQGLARPCGHHRRHIPAGAEGGDHRLLPRPKGVIAKIGFQGLQQFHRFFSFSRIRPVRVQYILDSRICIGLLHRVFRPRGGGRLSPPPVSVLLKKADRTPPRSEPRGYAHVPGGHHRRRIHDTARFSRVFKKLEGVSAGDQRNLHCGT